MRFQRFPIFAALSLLPALLAAAPSAIEPLIRLNQIGYLPDGNKVAVIADPQVGPDANLAFQPGPLYQVRRWADDTIVLEASPSPWNNGAIHAQSGDRGWWLDFSAVSQEGSYYLWDVEKGVASHRFEINDTIYDPILRAAVRTYFYQRCAFAKEARYAGQAWADGAAFIHPGQDTEIRSVYDRDNPETERDLRGGWMDAGDYNKYVTFAESAVHQLLAAYEERPGAFRDNYGIPESGNGIPDLLDELHFEMLWVSRMQQPDGGVIQKMGEIDHEGVAPPSADRRPRYYVPVCSSSTIAAAGLYAHASLVFRDIEPWGNFAEELEHRARKAWEWYHANPRSADCDEQIVKAGDADRSLEEQDRSAVVAAIYLHLLTGQPKFRAYVLNNYKQINPLTEAAYLIYSNFAAEALLRYAAARPSPGSFKREIGNRMLQIAEEDSMIVWDPNADLYRSHMPDDQHHWGSNSVKANVGSANYNYIAYGYAEAGLDQRRLRAENALHYFLGLNPMGLVYLTRMEPYGAEKSAQQIFHTWFAPGTPWDSNPPLGYVPGGPNKNYTGAIEWLKGLPPQKSYLDFNDGWPEASWEITEPAIYYQAAFIKLLSKFTSIP